MEEFNQDHLAVFKETIGDATPWKGKSPYSWAQPFVDDEKLLSRLPDHAQSRQELRHYCLDPTNSAEACYLAVMAWGGQRAFHAARAWAGRGNWLALLDKMRGGDLTRKESYESFAGLRQQNRCPRLGPAFFTKLIFFTRSKPDGFIMDQWTGKSMNLLTDYRFPRLNSAGVVTDDNTGSDYESYCQDVERLTAILGKSKDQAHDIEEALFSIGGRNAGGWRSYVKNNWKKGRPLQR